MLVEDVSLCATEAYSIKLFRCESISSGRLALYKKEHLSCLIDAGRVESIGWFVTDRLDVIELGLCHFDGAYSGFRWNEETGWEAIFLRTYNSSDGSSEIIISKSTEGNPYTVEEIATALEEFSAKRER